MSTLRDVARLSGVSPATVSNVLNNRLRNTTPETRQRVLDAIRQLGYHPGAVPPGGARKGARTIGVVMWLAYDAPLSAYTYALTLLDGILSVSLANKWNLTMLSVEHWDDARAQVRLYADGRCDGFLIVAPPRDSIAEALLERHYPFVILSSGDYDPRINCVGIDDVTAAKELTSYILSKGHKRIAYLIGEEVMVDTVQRIEGYMQAHSDGGVIPSDEWIIRPGDYGIPVSMKRFNKFLDRILALPRAARPTALMCGNDQLAYNAWKVLLDRGLNVPEDMSLAGFDGTHYANLVTPSLCTVRQPLFEMGKKACSLLLELIATDPDHNREQEAVKVVFPHELIKGESIAKLTA